MRLLRHLSQLATRSLVLAGVAGIVSGGSNAALVAWMSYTISSRRLTTFAAVVFAMLCAVKLVSGFVSKQLLASAASRALNAMRRQLCERVLSAPLLAVEQLGGARVMALLTDDVSAVSAALNSLPGLAVNLTVIIGCTAYLAWLSVAALTGILIVIAAGIVVYRMLTRKAMQAVSRARDYHDRLFAAFRTLSDGIIELKLHAARRAAFLGRVVEVASLGAEREQLSAVRRFALAQMWSQAIVYGALGAVLFGFHGASALPPHVMTGFVITIIYLTGPLAAALQGAPTMARADVALERIDAITRQLPRTDSDAPPEAEPFQSQWRRIELDGVMHAYAGAEESFVLGPISLDICRGEILFISGGNGSGKSTLAKLIAGLYEPAAGAVRVDGVPVSAGNRAAFRELFSSVFSPFCLFESLLGLDEAAVDDRARRLLERFELDGRVSVHDGRWSTTDLSQGQRKRLALITAVLEGRSLYILDEWAADQDAAFRDVFYLELLPELRRHGHTAIVISHDERYFHVADRVIRLEQGRIDRTIGVRSFHQERVII